MLTNKKTNKREARNKLITRILCLFLAALMVLGAVYYALAFLAFNASALTVNTKLDPLLAIGIQYGSDSEAGWDATSPNGFKIGKTVITETTRTFEEIWEIPNSSVTAAIDYNLSRYGGSYQKEHSGNYAVGMYHIEVGGVQSSRASAENLVNKLKNATGGVYSVFPGYINGNYKVYVGDFSTREKAETAISNLSYVLSSYSTRIVGTANTTVSIIDNTTNSVLFEYDCGTKSYIGLEPIQKGYEQAYTRSSQNYLYPGVMVFKRYIDAYTDGVEAINLVNMETYITGVLPWEIFNTWAYEVQRVFAIAARTFAVGNSRRHFASNGFDICPTQHCQAYCGCSRTNDNVLSAVLATKGMVVSYEGKTATISYCSSMGGETVTSASAWGGSIPYLKSIKTPWEQYSDYENGIWHTEVSPYELAALLRDSYPQLSSGYISSVSINSYADNTGYVYSITFTDSQGHTATATRTDNVRSVLWRYVHSANFVVGKGKATLNYDVVTNLEVNIKGVASVPEGPAYPDLFDQLPLSAPITVITGNGVVSGVNETLVAITNYGRRAITSETASVLTTEGNKMLVQKILEGTVPAPSYTHQISFVNPGDLKPTDLEINASTKTVSQTYYASSGENYIFAGKGFGHGVGLSQYGALDLANAGVPAELIINTYFPGTEIVSLTQLN